MNPGPSWRFKRGNPPLKRSDRCSGETGRTVLNTRGTAGRRVAQAANTREGRVARGTLRSALERNPQVPFPPSRLQWFTSCETKNAAPLRQRPRLTPKAPPQRGGWGWGWQSGSVLLDSVSPDRSSRVKTARNRPKPWSPSYGPGHWRRRRSDAVNSMRP